MCARRLALPLLVLIFAAPWSSRAGAQSSEVGIPVTVLVIDSATLEPIPDAEVNFRVARLRKLTSASGVAAFSVGPAQPENLDVRRLGYRPIRALSSVLLAAGDLVTVALVAIPRILPSVTVDARMTRGLLETGFDSRKRRFNGFFMDPVEIARLDPARMSDILAHSPGVVLSPAAAGGRNVRFGRAQNCPPVVYVDGVVVLDEPTVTRPSRLRGGAVRRSEVANDVVSRQDQGIDEISAQHVAAVEAYSSSGQVPPEYSGSGSSCGVILVWTAARLSNPRRPPAP